MTEHSFKKGTIIVREGDIGRCMYEILKGSVSVFIQYGTEDERQLTNLVKGQYFGELAVMGGWPRTATIVANADDTMLGQIEREELVEMFKNDPEKVKEILENLSHRVRDLTAEYMDVCSAIHELDKSHKEEKEPGQGLLSRIAKFLGFAKSNPYDQWVEEKSLEQSHANFASYLDNADFLKGEHCQKGQVVFRQGDKGTCMYYVSYGKVGIYSMYGTNDQTLLTTLENGSFFGEMGLIEGLPRSATAVIMENQTILRVISEDDLLKLFETMPDKAMDILEYISNRLVILTRNYLTACRTLKEMVESRNGTEELDPKVQALVNFYMAQAMSGNFNLY